MLFYTTLCLQGVMMADAKKIGEDQNILIRLWLHECTRIFRDRLTDEPDREWFDKQLKTMVTDCFKKKWEQLVTTDRLIFGDFMVPGADPRLYIEIDDQVCVCVRSCKRVFLFYCVHMCVCPIT